MNRDPFLAFVCSALVLVWWVWFYFRVLAFMRRAETFLGKIEGHLEKLANGGKS